MPTPSRSHNYGLNDIQSLFNDALYGNNGILPNLSFMPPRDPSEYDNIAWTARRNQQELFKQFIGQTVGQTANRRAAAMSSALGIGRAGMSVFNGAMTLDPRTAMSLIGHHGGADAVRAILSMGNSMAYARGAQLGGVLDPTTLIHNTNFAAVQGGMAYANNFNIDGSINAEQTRGLSLPAVGYVIGRTLSDRSSYSAWASRIRKGDGLTASERTLTESDIKAFTGGEKMDPKKFEAASNSFNEDIKKMTRELNGLIASVSKMTGSCDEAIRFLDSYTNGNLTSATESAKQARSRAAKLAANIRVTAADAGVSPEELYSMRNGFQNYSALRIHTLDQKATEFGVHKKLFADTSGLATLAYAEWAKTHAQANAEQRDEAMRTIGLQVKGYTDSGMWNLNTVVARMKVLRPDMDTREYEQLVRRGDAVGARKWAEANVGLRNVFRALNEEGYADKARLDPNVRNEVAKLDMLSLQGQGLEQRRKGQFGMFLDTARTFIDSVNDTNAREQIGDIDSVLRNQMLSDDVLLAAGVKRSEIKKFRGQHASYDSISLQNKLFKLAGDNGRSGDDVLDLIQKKAGEAIAAKLSPEEGKSFLNAIKAQTGGGISDEDIRIATDQLALEAEREDINNTKARAIRGDRGAMGTLIEKGGNKFTRTILEGMNKDIAEQLAKVGGKTSPEKLMLNKKELDSVNERARAELSAPGNTRTFEEITRDILRDKYSDKLLNSEDLLDSMSLIGADGNLSEKAMASFGDIYSENFKSRILGYNGFVGGKPSKEYRLKVTPEQAGERARRNKDSDNLEVAQFRETFATGGTLGDAAQAMSSVALKGSIQKAGDRILGKGEGDLAEAVAEREDYKAAEAATAMPFSEAGGRDFKLLTEDIQKRTKLANEIESEFNKKGGKWKDDLKKAVSSGDEEALNKIFGDNKSFKSMKDLGMSALEAGKIISAGLDTQNQERKDLARQDAIIIQKSGQAGVNDAILQILMKIFNLLQGAVK